MAYYTLIGSGGGGSGASNWVDLGDTPGTITANALVYGNSGGTAVEQDSALQWDGTRFLLNSSGNNVVVNYTGGWFQAGPTNNDVRFFSLIDYSSGLGTTNGIVTGTVSGGRFAFINRDSSPSPIPIWTFTSLAASLPPDYEVLSVGYSDYSNNYYPGFYYNPAGTAGDDRGLNIIDDGLGATSTDALHLRNNTAATAGIVQQYSPAQRFTGEIWITSASQTANAWLQLEPTSASGQPQGKLVVIGDYNGSATDIFEFNSNTGGTPCNFTYQSLFAYNTNMYVGTSLTNGIKWFYATDEAAGFGSGHGFKAGSASSSEMQFINADTAPGLAAFAFTWDHGQATTQAGKIVTFGETLSDNGYDEHAFIGTAESHIEQAHAGMYISSSSTTTVTTAGTPVQIAGTYAAHGTPNNISHSAGVLTYDGSVDKSLKVTVSVAAHTTGGASTGVYQISVAVNGTEQTGSVCSRYVNSSNIGSWSTCAIVDVSNGDTISILVDAPSDGDQIIFDNLVCCVVSA